MRHDSAPRVFATGYAIHDFPPGTMIAQKCREGQLQKLTIWYTCPRRLIQKKKRPTTREYSINANSTEPLILRKLI